jgi:hypothetical protein
MSQTLPASRGRPTPVAGRFGESSNRARFSPSGMAARHALCFEE